MTTEQHNPNGIKHLHNADSAKKIAVSASYFAAKTAKILGLKHTETKPQCWCRSSELLVENGILSIPLLGHTASGASCAGQRGSVFTLSEFIAGPENRLATVAISAVLQEDQHWYSPVVLYGPPGTGKSHLAIGLASAWTARRRRRPAVYATSIDFARELTDAIETQAVEDFRDRFRRTSLFILDDLDHLVSKQAAQQELVHTLDTLESHGNRVVVTASHPPAQLAGLSPALVSRLIAGLLVPLARPAADTRFEILRRLAALRSIELDESCARALAEGIEGTVSDLSGALVQLEVSSRLDAVALDLERVRQWLSERDGARVPPSLREIAVATARHFSLKLSDLRSPCRQRAVVTARGVAMYLARTLTRQSLKQIGRYFGGRDHTTVSYSCSSTERLLESEPAIREAVETLQQRWRVA